MENKETAGLLQGILLMLFPKVTNVFVELIKEISELEANNRCDLT